MWNGFESREFTFYDRKATIVYPKGEPVGRMLLKTEYLGAFPTFDIAMLEKGYYLINIKHKNNWAPDEETHLMAEFVRFCAKELNASERCVLEGLSCGGLQAARFAQLYPQMTALLYLDAPVLNILSMAGLGRCKDEYLAFAWQGIQEAYGVDASTIVNFRESPIDYMDILINNNIPVIMVYGDADRVVIYEENGKVLEEYYRKRGGILELFCKPGCEHHPHGLEDTQPILNFVETYFK